MVTPRKKIPSKTETKVLTRSKRRCCLCVGIDADFTVKQIQIAHIDRNRQNNLLENLVALCLAHHDEYDSRKSQSKGITKSELKHYRSELDKVIEKIDEQLQIQISKPLSNETRISTPSAKLIGEILEAFDREFSSLEKRNRPTGITLTRLAVSAIEEKGDFDAAIEAFMSLLRLAHLVRNQGIPQVTNYGHNGELLSDKLSTKTPNPNALPSANETNSSISVLEFMSQIDFSLFNKAVNRARLYSIIGDSDETVLSTYELLPSTSFGIINTILVEACHRMSDMDLPYACKAIAESLAGNLLGLGFVLDDKGIELPEPPTRIVGHDRFIEPEHHRDLLPLVSLANGVATLPEMPFKYAMKSLENFYTGIFPAKKVGEEGTGIAKGLEILKQRCAIPNSNVMYLDNFIKRREELEKFNTRLQEANFSGNKVRSKIVDFLKVERKLAKKSVETKLL